MLNFDGFMKRRGDLWDAVCAAMCRDEEVVKSLLRWAEGSRARQLRVYHAATGWVRDVVLHALADCALREAFVRNDIKVLDDLHITLFERDIRAAHMAMADRLGKATFELSQHQRGEALLWLLLSEVAGGEPIPDSYAASIRHGEPSDVLDLPDTVSLDELLEEPTAALM